MWHIGGTSAPPLFWKLLFLRRGSTAGLPERLHWRERLYRGSRCYLNTCHDLRSSMGLTAPGAEVSHVCPTPSGALLQSAEVIQGESFATGSAACVPAGQDRPDDPQDREDEADEAKDPMAFAEAEDREDDQQDKVDDA